MAKGFLQRGNGNQTANRNKALAFVLKNVPGITKIDARTIELPPYGICHFAAYTHADGAMISTPNNGDQIYGGADWHKHDRMVLFRDYGDGRVAVFVCPIKPLFEKRTIGHHGVRWDDVVKLAEMKQIFRTSEEPAR